MWKEKKVKPSSLQPLVRPSPGKCRRPPAIPPRSVPRRPRSSISFLSKLLPRWRCWPAGSLPLVKRRRWYGFPCHRGPLFQVAAGRLPDDVIPRWHLAIHPFPLQHAEWISFVQAAELENGTQKLILMEKLRSLSEILFRSDVDGLSQEGREDSDYGDEMELDETTVSGHGNRENDQGVFRGTLSF
jgi:hypothetical protein